MNHPFMKIPLFLFALALFLVGTAAGPAVAQEDPDKQEIRTLQEAIKKLTEKTADISEMFSDEAAEELSAEAEKLEALLDLDDMEDEVSDLFEMNREERGTVRDLLEDFREHWIQGESCICHDDDEDDEWFHDLLEEAEDELSERKADRFIDWLDDRKDEVERAEDRLQRAAEKFGEAAGQWAEDYAEEFAEEAELIEQWAEEWGEDWEEWGEEWGEEWEEWAEEWGEDWEEYGEEWEQWGEEWEEEWSDWADELADEIASYSEEYAEEYAELADEISEDLEFRLQELLENTEHLELEALAEMADSNFEVFGEEIERIVERAVNEQDWDRLGEEIEGMVEGLGPHMEGINFSFNDENLQFEIQAYTERIHEAAETLRRAVDRKRDKLDAHHHDFQQALQEALTGLGLSLEQLGRHESHDHEAQALREARAHFERAARLRDREADHARRERMELEKIIEDGEDDDRRELLHELREQQEEIRDRDDTLRSLKDEIRMLKEEIREMKREQRSKQEGTMHRDTEESNRNVCEVSVLT